MNMKKKTISARFFAKAEGASLGWRERLAKLKGGKAKPKATAKLEIDDATGETLIFPEIGDVSEIAEGVAVTATDGEHVFVADATTYTVTVLNGAITAVVETPVEEQAQAMNEETAEFVEAVAEALEANETFQATALAEIESLKTGLATANATIATFSASLSHAVPPEGEGGDPPRAFKIGNKEINISKINLNSKNK